MIKVPKGWRRLCSNDVAREGDVEWPKDADVDFISSNGSILAPPTIKIGCQMCTEEMYNYTLSVYRRLKNAPKQT